MFAFHKELGIVGEVVEETIDYISNSIDGVFALFGGWFPSDDIRTHPHNEWRIFGTRKLALSFALREVRKRMAKEAGGDDE
jgi:hypothetical protein